MAPRTRVIGIAGGSGSGKSTLAAAVAARLGPSKCTMLAQDRYYRDQSARFDRDGGSVNFDHPDAIDFPLLAEHLHKLRQGKAVDAPRYDFATHSRERTADRLDPRPFVVLDGILVLSRPEILPLLDAKVFVDAPEEVRFARRLTRDVRERGRTEEGVMAQWEAQVKPMHDEFVQPGARNADLVLSGTGELEEEVEAVMALLEGLEGRDPCTEAIEPTDIYVLHPPAAV
ncbi:uridine kinase [Hyaloraphidium curvatum]|nr:uridine kinase [Hyaloraphidium curvatum]